MTDDENFIGDCRNEMLVNDIFGSVTDFAYQIETHGNNFTYKNVRVVYDETTDIHSFYFV